MRSLATAVCLFAATVATQGARPSGTQPVELRCVDRAGKPVVGAIVHLFQWVMVTGLRFTLSKVD